jgi:hypothetical protein
MQLYSNPNPSPKRTPNLKPAAHESYLLSKKLLVPVSSADSSPIKHV